MVECGDVISVAGEFEDEKDETCFGFDSGLSVDDVRDGKDAFVLVELGTGDHSFLAFVQDSQIRLDTTLLFSHVLGAELFGMQNVHLFFS